MLAQPQNVLRRQPSLESNASSALATVASPDPSNATSPIAPMFTALCMFDYEPDRAGTIPFKRNDLLTIVHKEDSGWWAALVDEQIGWVPKYYLRVLTPEMATTMRRLPHAMRMHRARRGVYHREFIFNPITVNHPSSSADDLQYADLPPSADHDRYQDQLTPPYNSIDAPTPLNPPEYSEDDYDTFPSGNINVASPQTDSPLYTQLTDDNEEPAHACSGIHSLTTCPSADKWDTDSATRAPAASQTAAAQQTHAPTPVGKDHTIRIQQPIPPTYRGRSLDNTMAAGHVNGHTFASPGIHRSISVSATASLGGASGSSHRSTPSPAITRLPTAFDQNLRHEVSHSRSESPIGDDPVYSPPRNGRKVAQITGDDDAQAFHNAKMAQANLPWYLKPRHDNSDIKLEYDGTVIAGTVLALIERLTVDPLSKCCGADSP
jgi:son of sevenless-like protein